MEQHSIIEELLALRQEVQSLKFLNGGGGAISDLISRVSVLEKTTTRYPDYGNLLTWWEFGQGKKDGLMCPSFVKGQLIESPRHTIPYDGFLSVRICMNPSGTLETDRIAIRFLINGVVVGMAAGANCKIYTGVPDVAYDNIAYTTFVKKGDTFSFQPNNISQDSPDHNEGSSTTVNLFGFK